VLLGFVLTGVALSVVFENRVFCRYVCPVGGFIGLYSQMSPIELRVQDTEVCRTHTPKDCITGNENGYGCPWMVYPGALTMNTYCGMCMECLKTCPHNNIVINIRAPGSDLNIGQDRRLDEAYKAFIMLTCALMYSAVLLGPWGWIKNWANMDSLSHWALYAMSFVVINLALLPGLFWLASAGARLLSKQRVGMRRLFVDYATALIPLGLAGWIAFSIGFALVNGSYALNVISDPFGWGWNLFGTRDAVWTPLWLNAVHFLQVGILTVGLLFALNTVFKVSLHLNQQRALLASLPVTSFCVMVVMGFLRLYLG
jgi:ferredoxin